MQESERDNTRLTSGAPTAGEAHLSAKPHSSESSGSETAQNEVLKNPDEIQDPPSLSSSAESKHPRLKRLAESVKFVSRRMIHVASAESGGSTQSSSSDNHPKQHHHPRLERFADNTSNLAIGLVPQGIVLRRAERAYQREAAQASGGGGAETINEGPDPAEESAHRRQLFTEDRLSGLIDSPSWGFVRSYYQALSHLFQFETWWSYPLLPLLLLFPLWTSLMVLGATVLTTAACGVYDAIHGYVKEQDLRILINAYGKLVMNQWRQFKSGVGRRRVLIVVGIALQIATRYQ